MLLGLNPFGGAAKRGNCSAIYSLKLALFLFIINSLECSAMCCYNRNLSLSCLRFLATYTPSYASLVQLALVYKLSVRAYWL